MAGLPLCTDVNANLTDVQGVLNGFADQHRAVIYAMESGRNCAAPPQKLYSLTRDSHYQAAELTRDYRS